MYLALEESVGFEPTEHFCSTVFKTVAITQTLPTFHVYRHTILVVSFDHRKIAISMSYVRIRLYSSAVDVYTRSRHFNVSLHYIILTSFLTAVKMECSTFLHMIFTSCLTVPSCLCHVFSSHRTLTFDTVASTVYAIGSLGN